MKSGRTGLSRIFHATRYSFRGLKSAWLFEAAFRQELLLIIILAPFLSLASVELSERLLMFLSLSTLLLTELLNSAVEVVVDRIGTEHHHLSGRAKDIASAAVFIAIIQCAVIWTAVLWP